MAEADRVGEVIEASTAGFTAQCYELYQPPPLGSLVKTGDSDIEIYGVVCNATTTSFEPGRRPIARGKDEASQEAVYQSSPQLAKLLRSEFGAMAVGHREGKAVRQYLPPQPARIHGFVYLCPTPEMREFSQSLGFLGMLLSSRLPIPPEELVAACLRHMSREQEDPRAFLVKAGRQLAVSLGGNLNQLNAILERMKL